MKQIELTKGKFAVLDDDCFERINRFKWFADKHRNTWYAVRDQRIGKKIRFQLRMHSFVIGSPMPGFEIDHINGDGLDNRKSNLRIVSKRGNQSNRTIHRAGKSVGTSFDRRRGKWYSRIYIDSKQMFLGYFESEKKASDAYESVLSSITR